VTAVTRLVLCVLPSLSALAAPSSLVVVEDRGGVSALPYYQALNLQPRVLSEAPSLPLVVPPTPAGRRGEVDMLPVRSPQLTPGEVTRRVIQAPGLSPIFLVGDDARSRAWLRQRIDTLRKLGAIGLIVNVESSAALDALRRLAPGLTLAPTPADDLALRLGLRHYPVLITATGIEQ
jgi:integrating conjugative element protein (TIGR03765 family)